MGIGTNGNDTLATTDIFEFISGLDGDDSLTSTHNFTSLIGGTGSDTLTTITNTTATAVRATQLGGSGNDSLTFTQAGPTLGSDNTSMVVVLDGGDNNDTLIATAPHVASGDVDAALQANGGSGADIFHLTLQASSAGTANAQFVLDAGIGDDVITSALASSQTSGPSARTVMYIDLGNGDDSVFSSGAGARSTGANTVVQDILGRAGSDTIDATVVLSSQEFATGGSGDVTQTIDGGAGNDSINSYIFANVDTLDDVTGSVSLTGGNGSDFIRSDIVVDVLNSSDIDAVFDGGAGNDTVQFVHDIIGTPGAGIIRHDTTTDLGGSNDYFEGVVRVGDVAQAQVFNLVTSDQGFNSVFMDTNVITGKFATGTNSVVTGGNADWIRVDSASVLENDGTVLSTDYADARAFVTSGGGNDTVYTFVDVLSSGTALNSSLQLGGFAVTSVTAGGGADFVASTTTLAAETAGVGTLEGFMFIDGGTGKDTISNTLENAFGAPAPAVTQVASTVDGGAANDTISSNIDLTVGSSISGQSQVFGGSGTDVITTGLTLASAAAVNIGLTETTRGGAGLDTITATLDTSGVAAGSTGLPIIRLFGEAGTDTISATALGTLGAFEIYGGDANDVITLTTNISNPVQSLAYGDAGNDTLTGGAGREQLYGGTGQDVLFASAAGSTLHGGPQAAVLGDGEADTFVFDPTISQGSTTIRDFEFAHDILQFTGLVDAGAPGLADDIDALIVDFADFGIGTDRYIVLSTGSYIQFDDTGTGAGTFTSIADMVADPLTQLIA